MSDVHVTFRLQLPDVLYAARLSEGEAWKTTSRVVAGLLVAWGIAFWALGSRAWAMLWMALAVIEWFNLLPLSVVVAYLEFRRNPKYREQYALRISEEGLSFQTSNVSSELKWSFYSTFWETSRAFVLSYGRGVPTAIPKSAFVTTVELETVRGILRTAFQERRD